MTGVQIVGIAVISLVVIFLVAEYFMANFMATYILTPPSKLCPTPEQQTEKLNSMKLSIKQSILFISIEKILLYSSNRQIKLC